MSFHGTERFDICYLAIATDRHVSAATLGQARDHGYQVPQGLPARVAECLPCESHFHNSRFRRRGSENEGGIIYVPNYAKVFAVLLILQKNCIVVFQLNSGRDGFLVEYLGTCPPYQHILQLKFPAAQIAILDREGESKRRHTTISLIFASTASLKCSRPDWDHWARLPCLHPLTTDVSHCYSHKISPVQRYCGSWAMPPRGRVRAAHESLRWLVRLLQRAG